MAISFGLVLLGGVFAGLTLGLMGQDEIMLQVLSESGEPAEQANARKVYSLLKRGKHWVLVTLLLSNVVVNETLPIVFDSVLGGGWPAVLISTVLIVIFGEVIPQSICVRYGLSIGAYLSPFVLVLMYILYPISYPIAKLLDRALGEDHGTTYKKAGLKSLVSLHRNFGIERLNEDEVTIISAVLDLKDKPVGSIMTPMQDVYTLPADRIMDESTMDEILNAGYSRIPIYSPNNPTDFIGMLLVKILITYDPDDCRMISTFPLATLPETKPITSCLDILNFFQEGKSHMVLVSASPGKSHGALGVLTLEDVIEELIGEEIIDETDVYVDVHRHLRRIAPSTLAYRKISSKVRANTLSSNKNSFSEINHSGLNIDATTFKAHIKPLNPATDPRVVSSTKITIKSGQQPMEYLNSRSEDGHRPHEKTILLGSKDEEASSRRTSDENVRSNSMKISDHSRNQSYSSNGITGSTLIEPEVVHSENGITVHEHMLSSPSSKQPFKVVIEPAQDNSENQDLPNGYDYDGRPSEGTSLLDRIKNGRKR